MADTVTRALMPRPRKPYVQREITRHGRPVWYFRRGDGPRTRLNGDYESPEWLADYEAALAGSAGKPTAPRPGNGTLGWLIDRYMQSVAFATLAPGTRKMRRSILLRVKTKAGHWTLAQVTRKKIVESRDARSATPAAAVNFVKVMKALFAWGLEAEHVKANPCDGLSTRAPKTDGHHTWTADEVRAYWKRWPLGTMPRLAMDVMLFTGMRISDAVQFGRQHVRDGWVQYRSQKTGVEVDLPLLDPLRMSIEAAAPADTLAYIVTERGQPFASAASLGNQFRGWCIAAGVPGRAHGLRKAGASIAAENGASDRQLMAYWGWTDPKQVAPYTRRASRTLLARAAGDLLVVDEDGTSIPAPDDPVRG